MSEKTIYIYSYFCDCGHCDGDTTFYLYVPPEVAKAFPNSDDAIEEYEFLERQGYVFKFWRDKNLTRERQVARLRISQKIKKLTMDYIELLKGRLKNETT